MGNPRTDLLKTRHNVGFMLMDFLAEKLGGEEFGMEKKFQAEVVKVVIPDRLKVGSGISKHTTGSLILAASRQVEDDLLLFAKPQTFMNSSGMAVRKIVDFYKLHIKQDVVLIHDDLDIPLGEFKIQYGRGPRVHNGVNSVIQQLGTTDFWRIRIGVAGKTLDFVKKENKSVADNYVLKDFSKEEQQQLPGIFEKIWERLSS